MRHRYHLIEVILFLPAAMKTIERDFSVTMTIKAELRTERGLFKNLDR
jgi:hypothetical protein